MVVFIPEVTRQWNTYFQTALFFGKVIISRTRTDDTLILLFYQGDERPYACVDFKRSTNKSTDLSVSNNGSTRGKDPVQYAVFCPTEYQPCGQGDDIAFLLLFLENQLASQGEVCLDKCCRDSKVLQTSDDMELECVDTNHSEWSPKHLQEQLRLSSLTVRSSYFYLQKNPKVLSSHCSK